MGRIDVPAFGLFNDYTRTRHDLMPAHSGGMVVCTLQIVREIIERQSRRSQWIYPLEGALQPNGRSSPPNSALPRARRRRRGIRHRCTRPEGTVQTWNPGAEQITGYEATEILGEHVSVLYPTEAVDTGEPDHHLAVAARSSSLLDQGVRIDRPTPLGSSRCSNGSPLPTNAPGRASGSHS